MLAKQVKKMFVKRSMRNEVGVIAISEKKGKMFWYHIHDDEKIPEKDFGIAIHIRKRKLQNYT